MYNDELTVRLLGAARALGGGNTGGGSSIFFSTPLPSGFRDFSVTQIAGGVADNCANAEVILNSPADGSVGLACRRKLPEHIIAYEHRQVMRPQISLPYNFDGLLDKFLVYACPAVDTASGGHLPAIIAFGKNDLSMVYDLTDPHAPRLAAPPQPRVTPRLRDESYTQQELEWLKSRTAEPEGAGDACRKIAGFLAELAGSIDREAFPWSYIPPLREMLTMTEKSFGAGVSPQHNRLRDSTLNYENEDNRMVPATRRSGRLGNALISKP